MQNVVFWEYVKNAGNMVNTPAPLCRTCLSTGVLYVWNRLQAEANKCFIVCAKLAQLCCLLRSDVRSLFWHMLQLHCFLNFPFPKVKSTAWIIQDAPQPSFAHGIESTFSRMQTPLIPVGQAVFATQETSAGSHCWREASLGVLFLLGSWDVHGLFSSPPSRPAPRLSPYNVRTDFSFLEEKSIH